MYRKNTHWPDCKMTIGIAMGHLKASLPTTTVLLLYYISIGGFCFITSIFYVRLKYQTVIFSAVGKTWNCRKKTRFGHIRFVGNPTVRVRLFFDWFCILQPINWVYCVCVIVGGAVDVILLFLYNCMSF